MHRFRHQRAAVVPLRTKEQEFGKVSRLEACRLDTIRVLYHGYDCHEHHHTHDEGTVITVPVSILFNVL